MKSAEAIYSEANELLKGEDPVRVAQALEILGQLTSQEPGNAKAWFEFAGAYDGLGREAEALPHYHRALEIGFGQLPPEDQPRLFLQLGSTLRNLKKYEESRKVLLEGIDHFPQNASLKAFLGLTAYSCGEYRQAAKLFLQASLPETGDSSMRDYSRALRFYAEQIDTFPARQRRWMRIYLHDCEDPGDQFPSTRIDFHHANALSELLDISYRGTIDHEGESPEQCLSEIQATIGGKYGAFLATASFVSVVDGRAIGASMITLWKGDPLIAFTMTDPSKQGKGLAAHLIRKSLYALRAEGYKELYLVVTEGNVPAERLYRKLGFEFLGPAMPGRGVKE